MLARECEGLSSLSWSLRCQARHWTGVVTSRSLRPRVSRTHRRHLGYFSSSSLVSHLTRPIIIIHRPASIHLLSNRDYPSIHYVPYGQPVRLPERLAAVRLIPRALCYAPHCHEGDRRRISVVIRIKILRDTRAECRMKLISHRYCRFVEK